MFGEEFENNYSDLVWVFGFLLNLVCEMLEQRVVYSDKGGKRVRQELRKNILFFK